jgi:pimeloyl-ACP methyl ester carboxylesterase
MSKVTSKDGTVIAFDRLGQGPAVILISGASTSRTTNTALAELLASHFTVYNYDRRGRGDSSDTLPFAIEREFEDLEALIVEAGGSASLWGSSSGGVLALKAAAYGLPITKLALWEPPFSVDEEGRRRYKEYETRLNELLAEDRRGDAVELFMLQVGLPSEFIAQARSAPWWSETERLAPTLAYDAAVMGDSLAPAEQAASVMIPTLVIDGGAADPFFHAAAQSLVAAMPNAQLKSLDGQPHNVAPETIAPVLIEFFKD